jgi:hypothetical protein
MAPGVGVEVFLAGKISTDADDTVNEPRSVSAAPDFSGAARSRNAWA